MSLNYAQYVAEMASLCQFNPSDPFFVQQLPSAIDYATDRINRELNLLTTVAANSSLALTAGTRTLNFSAANINVLTDVNIITPAGQTNPELGARNPVTICDKSYLNAVYNSTAIEGVPINFALLDQQTLLFGPFPDANYTVELYGTVWSTPLSASNTTTWISTYIPDVFIAASMVFMSGAQKNFAAISDDPQSAMTWEQQYGKLRDSASVEDARRKFMSSGWTSALPSPINPPRT